MESLRVSALVEPVKCASSLRDNGSNLAEHLVFPHLCTTYPVTGKQPRAKHESVSIYLHIASPSVSNYFLVLFLSQGVHILFFYVLCISFNSCFLCALKFPKNVPISVSTKLCCHSSGRFDKPLLMSI